jgi:ankyrin repeat protein
MQRLKSTIRFATLTLAITIPGFSATAQHVTASGVPPKTSNLLQAAKDDDHDVVRRLIAHHADVNASEGDGFTALHWAAYNDDVELTKILLKAGAASEPRTRLEGVTPLILAADNGDATLIDALLAGGAKPDTANDNGTTPLMQAAAAGDPSVLKELLNHGANVNAREKTYGQSALFFAAANDRDAAVRFLTEHGADTTFKTNVQKQERIRVNADGEELSILKKNPGTVKDPKAVNADDVEAASTDAPAKVGEIDKTQLAEAGKHASETKRDSTDAYGFTPADRAAQVYGSLAMGGLTALHIAARNGQIDAVSALFAAHANINARTDTDKATPLLLALINGHYDVAKFLIDHDADVTLTSTDGLSPLYAVIDVQWAPHTWYPQPVTSQEKTTYIELINDLLTHQADVNAKLNRKLWFRVFANDETWVDVTGSTSFWRAAYAGDLEAMQILAAHGADINAASKSNDTPLMVATGLGWAAYWTSNAPSSRLDAVKFCLRHGADVNTRDVKGYTAIHGAAFRGDNAMIEYLLAHGADLQVTSKTGDTVADSANGLFEHAVVHPDTVALLEKLGSKSHNNCRSNECVVPPKQDKSTVVAKTDSKPAGNEPPDATNGGKSNR